MDDFITQAWEGAARRKSLDRLERKIEHAETDAQLLGYARQMRQVLCGGVIRNGHMEVFTKEAPCQTSRG